MDISFFSLESFSARKIFLGFGLRFDLPSA